jgi:hypothetical protein
MAYRTCIVRFDKTRLDDVQRRVKEVMAHHDQPSWESFLLTIPATDRGFYLGVEHLLDDHATCPSPGDVGDEDLRREITNALICTAEERQRFPSGNFTVYYRAEIRPRIGDFVVARRIYHQQLAVLETLFGRRDEVNSGEPYWPFGAFYEERHEAAIWGKHADDFIAACGAGGLLEAFRPRIDELFKVDAEMLRRDWEVLTSIGRPSLSGSTLFYVRDL